MRFAGLLLVVLSARAAAADPPLHPEPASDPNAPSDPDPPPPAPEEDHSWAGGDHVTGEWGGWRDKLGDHGVSLDVVYASDLFTAHGSTELLGHVDAALTLDTKKLGLWDGGTLYALVQNNHGSGINGEVGSASIVTNLEADPYTQLTELFYEHVAFDERLRIRIGKQDANRDFGTPRFGGNFINNSFGMFPTAPMPSYPTTGLGALVAGTPVPWLLAKLAIYEGSPEVGGFGLTTAFKSGGGYTLAGSVAATHHFGPDARNGGTTSVGGWWQSLDVMELGVAAPRTFDSDAGWFVQHDERLFSHPKDPKDPRGLTLILRVSWARPDRTAISRYAGASLAWHGLGPRDNDTTGIGAGFLTVADQTADVPGRGNEWFVEAFYKLRLTNFASLQPDLQWFRHPGGNGPDAWVAGMRLKLKL